MYLNASPNLLYKFTLILALIILLISSWNAPMSGDEYVHVRQAQKNIDYIKTLGQDKEALNTPISRLKHYGQSFDTLTTWLADVLAIDDLYRFRHVSNAFVAWLIILFTSLITLKISHSRLAAIITVILFLISPRFMGHAMNNLKDIPFAFAFVFSIYFIFRFITKLPKISWIDLGLLTLGIAFGISIRIGGLLIFAYFILFTGLYFYYLWVSGKLKKDLILKLGLKLGTLSFFVFLLSYFSSMLIWPFALENPLTNPLESLALMHHYPTTIRQIFEGKLFWSDMFPWYYLPKYLLITLPIIVLLGIVAFFGFARKLKSAQDIILSIFTLIAFGFPLFYASVSQANVYGGWRQMLFVFPPLLVASSIGIWGLYQSIREKVYLKITGIGVFILLIILPVRFSIINYPYQYTFFNVLVGGTSGAYGKYELDYYFTSYKKAYEFIDRQTSDHPKIVAANFIIPEYYKGKPYEVKLIDYYDRSGKDWDYAVICNTFLDPYQVREGHWPPGNTVFTEQVNGKPIVAVLKRETKAGVDGKLLLNQGDYHGAIEKFNEVLDKDASNESVLLNLSRAQFSSGDFVSAELTLNRLHGIYPDNEWAVDLRGEIKLLEGKTSEAIALFTSNISYNYKFFHSYVNLARAQHAEGNRDEAIENLKACLRINPFYEPAYKLYGRLLIEKGDVELGEKMLQFSIKGPSKYGKQ